MRRAGIRRGRKHETGIKPYPSRLTSSRKACEPPTMEQVFSIRCSITSPWRWHGWKVSVIVRGEDDP